MNGTYNFCHLSCFTLGPPEPSQGKDQLFIPRTFFTSKCCILVMFLSILCMFFLKLSKLGNFFQQITSWFRAQHQDVISCFHSNFIGNQCDDRFQGAVEQLQKDADMCSCRQNGRKGKWEYRWKTPTVSFQSRGGSSSCKSYESCACEYSGLEYLEFQKCNIIYNFISLFK